MPEKLSTAAQTPRVSSHNRAGEKQIDPRSLEEGFDAPPAFANIILGTD